MQEPPVIRLLNWSDQKLKQKLEFYHLTSAPLLQPASLPMVTNNPGLSKVTSTAGCTDLQLSPNKPNKYMLHSLKLN